MKLAQLAAIAALALGVGACAPAPIQPDLPGCDQTTDFAFAGETTLAALGIAEFAGGQEAVRPGMIWVTARPVEVDRGPVFPGDAQPGMRLLSRMVCVRWADGSGMAGPIDDDWQLPPGPVTPSGDASAFPMLVVVAIVVVVIGVSVLAFRRDAAPGS